jgi:hypothetical protein
MKKNLKSQIIIRYFCHYCGSWPNFIVAVGRISLWQLGKRPKLRQAF